MANDNNEGLNDEEMEDVGDGWDEYRGESDPIDVTELKTIDLTSMPRDISLSVEDDYFPETTISIEDDFIVCHIEDHIYTKFWEHKFSAYSFAGAMERAVRRLIHEGHPFANPTVDDEDVHIFVRFDLNLRLDTPSEIVAESIKTAFDLVWQRADTILENSDSVLVLGKDTGPSLDTLKRIAAKLEDLGYYTYIIKEQPEKKGESVVQKVMRYALSSKFVIIENTEPSGHLYEIPHVAKAAECVSVVLQEDGKGATWMFEDAYAKHKHWHKITYSSDDLEKAVEEAAAWAEDFVRTFTSYQVANLPWLRPKP